MNVRPHGGTRELVNCVKHQVWELLLEDGARFRGASFGAEKSVSGEVVFATGMGGYVETLTDPSYRGQILVLTYPLQGNYGIPAAQKAAFQSPYVQVQGLVVSSATTRPNHHESVRTLSQWMAEEGVCAIEGVDTRAVTKHLREHGTLRGWIVPSDPSGDALDDARASAACIPDAELARRAADGEERFFEEGPSRVLLVDAGAKTGILRELLSRNLSVARVPFYEDLDAAARRYRVHGIVLSNGPGDPKDLQEYVRQVWTLLPAGVPLLGICLGCQVLALAADGDTYKLPYGHRSQNQPVRDLTTGRCYVTSQNHGYAVRSESLSSAWLPWFTNLNDGTNEGIRHASLPIRAVQFHPEGAPGPEDTRWVFDDFAADVEGGRVRDVRIS
jgi:carbamoyl-phosphate synthase small subunit